MLDLDIEFQKNLLRKELNTVEREKAKVLQLQNKLTQKLEELTLKEVALDEAREKLISRSSKLEAEFRRKRTILVSQTKTARERWRQRYKILDETWRQRYEELKAKKPKVEKVKEPQIKATEVAILNLLRKEMEK